MSELEQRAKREAEIWDQQALQRHTLESALAHANEGPSRDRRDHFIAEAVANLADKTVLEIGSQAWQPILKKNRVQPKSLTCINISQTELDSGRTAAEALGFKAEFRLMDAHKLDFPDGHFDFVYGVAILHHLNFETAMNEISRVTKPGGAVLFVEPLRLNPVAQLVRLLTPKARTVDELPLGRPELRLIARHFEVKHLFTELFSLPVSVLSRFLFQDPSNVLTRSGDAIDRGLLAVFPWLGPFCRTITVYGHKRNG